MPEGSLLSDQPAGKGKAMLPGFGGGASLSGCTGACEPGTAIAACSAKEEGCVINQLDRPASKAKLCVFVLKSTSHQSAKSYSTNG